MKDDLNAHLDLSTPKNRTASHRKAILYLKDLFDNPSFLQKVFEIRDKFGIPKNGAKEVNFQSDDPSKLYEEIEKLAKGHGVRDPFDSYLNDFVIHNDIDSEWEYGYREIVDLKQMVTPGKYESITKAHLSDLRSRTESHPIAILIDPYSSERDIFDLIRKTHKKIIEPLQKKYCNPDVKIGTVRKKSDRVKKRNDFIFKHRDNKDPELVHLVNKEFGELLEAAYIRKIVKNLLKIRARK